MKSCLILLKNYIADKIEKNSDEVRYSYFELKSKDGYGRK